jgi:hypothetical protein
MAKICWTEQQKKKKKKTMNLRWLDDCALAVFTVALLVAAVFALLGELTIAVCVLALVILVGVSSLLLRTTNQSSTNQSSSLTSLSPSASVMIPIGTSIAGDAVEERRRRILSAAAHASNVLKLGVIGFASSEEILSKESAAQLLATLLVDLQVTSRKRIVVVTDWIADGVSLIAFNEARRLGLPTVAFSSKVVKELVDVRKLDADEVFVVGRNSGDETLAFLTFVDGLVLMGGNLAYRHMFDDFKGPKFDLSAPLRAPSPPPEPRNVDD